jgi:hypothetical protein
MVIELRSCRLQKTRGAENEGVSHYVIENIGSEITILRLAIICMKTMGIEEAIHYIIDNKWVSEKRSWLKWYKQKRRKFAVSGQTSAPLN